MFVSMHKYIRKFYMVHTFQEVEVEKLKSASLISHLTCETTIKSVSDDLSLIGSNS